MKHDSEREAARFLGGELSGADRDAFSNHLLRCSACWREVLLARRGRTLAESIRTVAPVPLRDRVRALVEAESFAEPSTARWARRWTRRRWLAVLSVPVAAAAALALVLASGGGVPDPPALRQAVADFSAQRLPGAQLPVASAPDLSRLQLQPVGAGGGSYAGLEVDGYAYRDSVGRRIVLYLSDEPFPEAPGAELLAGKGGPWVAVRGDVIVLCARLPHAMLVVGQDDQLVRSTASALGVL